MAMQAWVELPRWGGGGGGVVGFQHHYDLKGHGYVGQIFMQCWVTWNILTREHKNRQGDWEVKYTCPTLLSNLKILKQNSKDKIVRISFKMRNYNCKDFGFQFLFFNDPDFF